MNTERKLECQTLRHPCVTRRGVLTAALPALLFILAAAPVRAGDKLVFKPTEFAILKLDEKPVKSWDVYLAEKRKLILVRIGSRYLLLDLAGREVFELAPETLEIKGKDVLWREEDEKNDAVPPPTKSERKPDSQRKMKTLLPTEEWKIRDAGPARIIQCKLSAEGRLLEVELRITPGWLRGVY